LTLWFLMVLFTVLLFGASAHHKSQAQRTYSFLTMSLVRTAITVLARLTSIGFLVVAAFTIPEAWSLNREQDYVRDGSTLFVPIQVCEPESILFAQTEVGNSTSSSNNNTAVTATFDFADIDTEKCHSLEYLINACVASVIIAMAALLIFFLLDTLVRCNNAGASKTPVLGMNFFLTFILVQAGVCCFAVYKEMDFWESYFQKLYDTMDDNDGITNVETHGNKLYLLITFILAIVSAAALLLDTLLIFCCGDNINRHQSERKSKRKSNNWQTTSEQPLPPPAANDSSNEANKQTGTEENAMIPYDEQQQPVSNDKPAWTNV